MKTSLFSLTVSLMLITFTGCLLFKPSDEFRAQDGNAGTASMELSDMGDATMEFFSGKTRTTIEDDTVNIDITIVPWRYEASCEGWVREAHGTTAEGNVHRHDTIWFYDANSSLLPVPTIETISHYKHVRSVNGSYYGSFDYRYILDVNIEKGADTVFIFNGNIIGNYNGETFNTTKITNVKRKVVHTGIFTYLSFPYEGTISIDRTDRTVFIEFGGQNTAQVIVTRKSDGKTWIFTVNVITGLES